MDPASIPLRRSRRQRFRGNLKQPSPRTISTARKAPQPLQWSRAASVRSVRNPVGCGGSDLVNAEPLTGLAPSFSPKFK